jgi:hypothetical protein
MADVTPGTVRLVSGGAATNTRIEAWTGTAWQQLRGVVGLSYGIAIHEVAVLMLRLDGVACDLALPAERVAIDIVRGAIKPEG